jgi:hypothetical protein
MMILGAGCAAGRVCGSGAKRGCLEVVPGRLCAFLVSFGRCVESRISKSHLTTLCTINPWQSALRSAIRVFVTKNLRVCPSAHA